VGQLVWTSRQDLCQLIRHLPRRFLDEVRFLATGTEPDPPGRASLLPINTDPKSYPEKPTPGFLNTGTEPGSPDHDSLLPINAAPESYLDEPTPGKLRDQIYRPFPPPKVGLREGGGGDGSKSESRASTLVNPICEEVR